MTSENNTDSFTTKNVVNEAPLLQQSESSSYPERDSVLTRGPTSDSSNTTSNLKRFDIQKEELANKIQQLEALVKEATTYSPDQSNVDSITSPEMEFRSSSGLFSNTQNIHLLREAVKGEPWPTANRSPAEIPPAGETNFEVFSEMLNNDDLNEAIASSSETLVGEGPEDQALLEDGAGELTPTYGYRDSGASFPFRDVGPRSRRYCEASSFGEKRDDLQLSQHDCNQMTAGDNLVRNFDDIVEMRVNDVPRKENEYLVAMGHPRDLPVNTKSMNSSSNGKTSNREKSKLKSSYLDGPSCRPKERRKQLKKSWSNQEALEPPVSPDRRASYNDLFSFTADEFYNTRLGGSPSSNFEDTNNTFNEGYTDSSLMYGEVRSEISHPNLDMNGRNIAEQINLTFKSKYNYDSEVKLPIDIKATPAVPYGLPPDPNYGSHLNSPINLHKKYGSEMRKASPRVRRISKPLSISETNKIYTSIKQSSKKMHRQLAVSDEGDSLGSSISGESQSHEQLHPNFDSFNCGGKRNEGLANYMELQRRTKLFFENMNKTDKETPRADDKINYRGRHSFPKDAADLPRLGELQTSNIYHTSSKSYDELDPNYDEKVYDFLPPSGKVREEHYPRGYVTTLEIKEQLKVQDSEHARFHSPSKFPSEPRPTPPTTLKFLEALPASPIFPPLGPLDRARSGPCTPIRPEKASRSRMRSPGSSIYDSYDLATRPQNDQEPAFSSQPWLLGNLPTEEIRRSNSFAMTTSDQLNDTRVHSDVQLQQLYTPRRQRMDPMGPQSLRNSRESVPFGRLSPVNPLETFEVSHSSQRSPSFGDGFPTVNSVSNPPSPVAPDLLKPPDGAPVRRGSIVSCDTLQASLDPHPDPVKIVVLGDDGVGKTALIVRLVTGRFIGDYDPSLEAVYSYRIPLDGYTEQLQLMDTAGQGAWRGEETQLQWSDAVLVVFSVTSARSLSVAGEILHHLMKGGRHDGKEGSVQDMEGGKRDKKEEADVNEKEYNEIKEQFTGRRINKQTSVKESADSDADEKVEEQFDMGKPESFNIEVHQKCGMIMDLNERQTDTIICSDRNITLVDDFVTEEHNMTDVCQELASVASLRKLATTKLTGLQKNNYTNVCVPPKDKNQEYETEVQEEKDHGSKHTILATEGFRNIENRKSCSKVEHVSSLESMVDIPRERTDETGNYLSMNSRIITECTTTTSAGQKDDLEVSNLFDSLSCEDKTTVQVVENNFAEMNLSDPVEMKNKEIQRTLENTPNAHTSELNATLVNKADSSAKEDINKKSNPRTLSTFHNTNNSSITECKKYSKGDSLQCEEKSTIFSQISPSSNNNSSPSTGVCDVLPDLQTSIEIKKSPTSSPTNFDKKELAEDLTLFLCKETVLLGNKSDLEHRREVSTAEGAAVAEQYHCHYSEIAASAPWEVVSDPFLDLYRQVLEGRQRKLEKETCANKAK